VGRGPLISTLLGCGRQGNTCRMRERLPAVVGCTDRRDEIICTRSR